MKIPEAKAAVDNEWNKLNHLPAWDLKEVQTSADVVGDARDFNSSASHHSMDMCHLTHVELAKTHPQRAMGEWWGTASRMMMVFKPCSRNRAHQLPTWPQQHSWIR